MSKPTILLATNDPFEGNPQARPLGLVTGSAVRARSQLGNFFSRMKTITGGKSGGFRAMVVQARQDALDDLTQNAQAMGADAVVSIRFDTVDLAAGQDEHFLEIIAYGTAVQTSQPQGAA